MRKNILSLIALGLLLLAIALPPALAEPQKVDVSIYVLNLGKFDIATGSFTADFYLSMTCEDNCSPENFEFMNGRATSIEKIIDEPREKFWRIQANLNSPVNLERFPFDKQSMRIIIEDKRKQTNEQVYVHNEEESGIDDSIAFTGWHIDGATAEVTDHFYPVYDEHYSQYVYSIDISKIAWNSFVKTLLPVLFSLLVVLSSFIIDPDKIANRLALVGSALVAAVMFHVSIGNQIPPVGYLTFADKFMLATYFILLVSFVIDIVLLELQERKKEKLVMRIHRATEFSMFGFAAIIYLLLFLFFL